MTQSPDTLLSEDKALFTHKTVAVLLLILLAGAVLRFIHFGQSPPGLNQDEAFDAWNAWCLLKTGTDQHGVSWPIFYFRGLGNNNATLYLYLLLPFQAVGGLNITTTRLPAAVGGVMTILLIYYVGARLFDRRVGLLAAALLTFNPWHIQQSRWGHEASICPLFGLLTVAALLWANFPVSDAVKGPPKPFRATLAGALAGVTCYGYPALRIFVPAFLFMVVLMTLSSWRRFLKDRKGALAAGAFVCAFAAIFGPMVWEYIFDYEGIARHNTFLMIPWADATAMALVKNAALRYIDHFSLDFLFINGDITPIQSPPGMGQFYWYMFPLMLAGIFFILLRFVRSISVRMLLAFVLAYPVSDSICFDFSSHALRSAPGLCSLVLLAGLGGAAAVRWSCKKGRSITWGLVTIFLIAAIFLNVRYLRYFYGGYNREPDMYNSFYVDLVEACDWLKPRFDDYDAIFCTSEEMGMPDIVTLVALSYDPRQWFRQPREFFSYEDSEWDHYTNYGKMNFMYPGKSVPNIDELRRNPPLKRVLFIVRPGELGLKNPIYRIHDPAGRDCLWLCQL